jgi:hypothetical protein
LANRDRLILMLIKRKNALYVSSGAALKSRGVSMTSPVRRDI